MHNYDVHVQKGSVLRRKGVGVTEMYQPKWNRPKGEDGVGMHKGILEKATRRVVT